MPVWHDQTREWVKQGKLALLGITQEQHPDRCRLFAQWQGFGWPILHDPINLMESPAVPIVVAIDEHGIVRAIGPKPETFARDFLDRTFDDDATRDDPRSPGPPDPDRKLVEARSRPDAGTWRAAGDALTIWGGLARITEAIRAYSEAVRIDPSDKNARFRLGVAFRMRYESPDRKPGDFQAAVDNWGRALELDPNQYIWRRRIEQYGPLLAKPYPFYDWVEKARAEIRGRGDEPIPLSEEPSGSELASPVGEFVNEAEPPVAPDPKGRIDRDSKRLIEVEVAVIPRRVRPGESARVHLSFRPNAAIMAHWNNESTPLKVWVEGADGWSIHRQLLEAPQGREAESDEVRRLDFEVKAAPEASGKVAIAAYALYNVCEESGGLCLFLRQDLNIEVEIDDPRRPEPTPRD
ncbi:hypothetical protein P12x_001699 [Tundrisphaera lichenicola]|uniref:hypothetical protein n=1 Tax=Tundrisphaera lichenicola TaxID=2029860 RepID=UPI003EBAF796